MTTNVKPSRLLIVDDNEMNRDMLARRLVRKGYVIELADNAKELLKRVQQDGVDLVLLDIEMPEVSGLDALKTLREHYSAAQLPIIMVTAKSQSDDIVAALDLGANDYLTKPIDFPVAVARIGTQLAHKQAREALKESEERYALAARGSNDGLWDWNVSANVVHFSPRWKAMLGYEDGEIGEKPEEWFDRIHDADRERVKEEIAAHQKGLTSHFESEHRMLHREGGFRWMLSRGVAVRDASGKVLRMAGSQTDITEGKVSDPLTGLPNRLLFIDRVGRLVKSTKRQDDQRQYGTPDWGSAADWCSQPFGEVFAVNRYRGAYRGNVHSRAPRGRRIYSPAGPYQGPERCQARRGPHDEGSGVAIHIGRERSVHLREHRHCIEQFILRASRRYSARCRHCNVPGQISGQSTLRDF